MADPTVSRVRTKVSPVVHLAVEGRETLCGVRVLMGIHGTTTEPLSCPLCIEAARRAQNSELAKIERNYWLTGQLRFLLDETQLLIDDTVEAAFATSEAGSAALGLSHADVSIEALQELPEIVAFLLCSRKLGKSAYCCVKALETCIRKERAWVQYFAPNGKDAADIAEDIMERVLLKTCPDEIRPKFNPHLKEYEFPNGSVIQFEGVNDAKIEDKRGPPADLAIGDECGSWDRFTYAIESVIKPMTLESGGRILLPTTPSASVGHPSKAEYEKRKKAGAAAKFVLTDSQRIPPIKMVKYLVEAGEEPAHAVEVVKSKGKVLPEQTTAQREYFCEFVTEAGRAVLPEWGRLADELTVRVQRAA